MQRSLFILSVFLLFHTTLFAQQSDTALISELVNDIAKEQVNKPCRDFYKGMFPSFRECGGSPHNYQPDNNIFYTAVSVFALKNIRPYVSEINQRKIQNIVAEATSCYPLYRNKNGLPFYGFWANKDVIMPHTFIFRYLKTVFGQSEDADDSVMALLGLDNNDSDNNILKERLLETSNLTNKKIISTFKRHQNVPAYSTWVGHRMPVDFDFGVHCNVLYFILQKKLLLTRQDSATIHLLAEMVKHRDYKKSPVYISPYYVKTSVLLYHISRLLGRFSIPELDSCKPQLVSDINEELQRSDNIMEQIILRTSLLRLGAKAPPLPPFSIGDFEHSNQKHFVFFQARAAFSYPTPLKQILLHWSYIYYYFYCPAYYKILWLEYLTEKQKHLHQ